MKVLYIFLFASILTRMSAQEQVYKDTVYDPDIHTVIWERVEGDGGWEDLPVVRMTEDSLKLQFDDLGTFDYDYYYEIIHCTRDWKQSPQLLETV